jgi:hypothetical protein
MSGKGFHVHGPHDHAVEHEAQGHGHGESSASDTRLVQWVAIFTAILATIGAIVSYEGGHTQNEALYYKNEAVLKKADASNQWAFFQAKSTKQSLAELSATVVSDKAEREKYAAKAKRYEQEKEEIKAKAEKLDAESDEANKKSRSALHPHDKLAQSMTFIQIAISLAAIFVLTRRRWMLGLAGVAAGVGVVYWILAFTVTGIPH